MSHFPLPLPLQSIHPLVLRKWERGGQSVASTLGGSKEIQRLFPGAWNPCEESITTTTSPVHPPVALPPSTSSRASDTQWNRKNSSPSRERNSTGEEAAPGASTVEGSPRTSSSLRSCTATDRDRRKPWRACQSGFVLPLERTPSAVCPAGVLRGRIRTKRDSVFCWCPPPLEFLATRSSSGPQGVESETSQLRAPPSSPGTQSVCRAQWSSSSEWQQEQQRTHEIYSCLPPSGTWGRRILPRGVSRQMRRLIDGIGSSCSHPPPLCGPITPGG